MKKISLVLATLLASQSAFAEDSSNDWVLNGNIRTAYISDDSDQDGDAGEELHDLAVGGSISLTTPKVKGFTATATLYTSQPLFGQNTDGWLVESDGSSYSYIGEAYVTGGVFGKTAVVLGKKVIDTPFANSDDIGMAPNSFEVYLVQNNDIDNLTLLAGRVTKWAGHDAPTRGEFSDLTGGDGASVLAGIYANDELGVSGQAWYYNLDNFAGKIDLGIYYLDATYSANVSGADISLSGQYTKYQMINGPEDDGTVFGGQLDVTYNIFNIGASFNQADGDVAPTNGFGSGPFYTSSDIMSIASSGKDSSAMKFYAGVEATDQISLSAGFLTLDPDEGDSFSEMDLGASYAYSDNLAIDLYFESWTDESDVDWIEYSIFANYSF